MEAGSVTPRGDRSVLERSPLSGLPDKLLRWVLTGLAAAILLLIAYFFVRLYNEAQPAFAKFGFFGFTFDNNWDVSKDIFGAWPLVVGTLITSAIALLLGVPIAVATALYVVELCPARLKGALTIMVELLAAVPSVVYGLWGIYVLIPKLLPAEKWFADTFHWIPFIGGGSVAGATNLLRGVVSPVMIFFIVMA